MTAFKKKVLSFALAGSMVLSSTGVAFAATSTEKLDKIVELGVIVGEGNGVIPDETLSRYRAFILQLRLLGKLEEFQNYKYEGKDTFEDADKYSDFVQKLASYLKTHPELGISGYDNGTLQPLEDITEKEYVVIMLGTLGYVPNVDFTWDNVMEFAASVGIVSTTKQTRSINGIDVKNVAIYTYDTLATPSKNGVGTLGEKLGYVVKDTLPPNVKFDTFDTTVETSSITLSGTLDEGGSLEINGENIILNKNLGFEATVALQAGKNEISVKTTDISGNTATQKLSITRVIKQLEVEDATSDSNKQFQVTFNNELDPATVKTENFTVKNNTVVKVQLEDDKKTVTVIVENKFEQQSSQTISKIENIKDIDGNTLTTVKDLKFVSKDITQPEIVKVEVEKNNEIRVTFSEPVQETQIKNTSNYELNGSRFVGSIKNYDYNTVVLYSKNFEDENTLTVKNMKDFNSLIMETQTVEFSYNEDTTAPIIVDASDATLESVRIKFNEKVDFGSVKKDNINWAYSISSTSGKKATSVEKVDDYTIIVNFKGDNSLPPTAVNIIFNSIKDLSGNMIDKNTSIEVNPIIDETRPEVTSVITEYTSGATSTTNGITKFTVNFSKNILDSDSTNNLSNNFEIIDEDGKKVNKTITLDENYTSAVNKIIFTVNNLAEGNYTLVVKNIKDDTKLANKMVDAEIDFSVANHKVPSVVNVYQSKNDNKLYVQFSESMNSTITDISKYMIKDTNGNWYKLSSVADGSITTMENETYAIITLKKDIANYTSLEISLVENAAGNALDVLKKTVDLTNLSEINTVSPSIGKVEVTAKDQLKVYLNKEVIDAYYQDFVITDGVSESVYFNNKVSSFDSSTEIVNGSKVSVLTFDFNSNVFGSDGLFENGTVVTVSANKNVLYTIDAFGNKLTGSNSNALDKIAPTLTVQDGRINAESDNKSVVLTFDENLLIDSNLISYAANDLVIVDNTGKTLVAGTDYTIAINDNKVTINFTEVMEGDYSISTSNNVNFIKDNSANIINSFNDITIVKQW